MSSIWHIIFLIKMFITDSMKRTVQIFKRYCQRLNSKVFFQISHQIIQISAFYIVSSCSFKFHFFGFFNPLCNDTIFFGKKVNKSMHFLATLSFKQCLFVGCIKVVEGGSRVNLWPESILKIGSHVAAAPLQQSYSCKLKIYQLSLLSYSSSFAQWFYSWLGIVVSD